MGDSRELLYVELIFPIMPHKRLIILDLNGTLIYKQHRKSGSGRCLRSGRPEFCVNQLQCWKRPGVDEFLERLFASYRVAVWTSAMKHNTKLLVKEIFKNRAKDLLFIYSRDECSEVSNLDSDFKSYKDLGKVWKTYSDFDKSNTIMIEDGLTKFKEHQENVLTVTPWVDDDNDQELFKLLDGFETT